MPNRISGRNPLEHVFSAARSEVTNWHPKLELLKLVTAVQSRTSPEQRANWLRRFGFRLGQGTKIEGMPQITGTRALFDSFVTGEHCELGADCILDLHEQITLGHHVTLGPGTMLLTSSHELGPSSHRAGNVTYAPVTVQNGAWVMARAIILPGVTIGEGAIVEVGAVVNKNVRAHTRVGGSPAVQLEVLEQP
jgi:acetyltransferase-like isoleucine patch superfamily enzyme